MNNQTTIDQLEKLKLSGMATTCKAVFNLSLQDRPSLELFMAKLTESEIQSRMSKKTEMYLKTSKLRYNAVPEEISCSSERNFTKEQLLSLLDCGFVSRAENLLITGKTGTGKSYLACALGKQACCMGLRTMYLSMNKFAEKLTLAKIDGSWIKILNQIEKNELIILDDFGLQPLDANTRLALLQILEDRYERKAVIVTSQLPVNKWYEYIGEPTLADAIMDRLTSRANRVELKGDSLRTKINKK